MNAVFRVCAVLALTALVGQVEGAFLSTRSQPTPDLPGFSTYTVSLTTETGETLNGVDGLIQGPMNQVNPNGGATVFPTLNGLFPLVGADPLQDSQFTITSPFTAIGADESSSQLKAAFTGLASLGLPSTADVFQIVTDEPELVSYDLAFDLRNGTTDTVDFSGCLVGNLCPGVTPPSNGGPGGSSPAPFEGRVFATSVPTTGLPGFSTYTLFFESVNGVTVRGIGSDITGPLNQVNPLGVQTLFDEANDSFAEVGASVDQDSQFLFGVEDLESFARAMESSSEIQLDMIFRRSDPQDNPMPFVQIVTDDPESIDLDLTFIGNSSSRDVRIDIQTSLLAVAVPEPATAAMLAYLIGAFGATRRAA